MEEQLGLMGAGHWMCRVYAIQCNPALYQIFTTTGEAQREAVRAAQQCLKPLEAALEGRRFFGGDAVGYLDIVVGWLAHWLPVIEEVSGASVVTDEELPLMKAWFGRFLAVDAVRAALPDRERLLAANKARREQILSSAA